MILSLHDSIQLILANKFQPTQQEGNFTIFWQTKYHNLLFLILSLLAPMNKTTKCIYIPKNKTTIHSINVKYETIKNEFGQFFFCLHNIIIDGLDLQSFRIWNVVNQSLDLWGVHKKSCFLKNIF